MEKEARKEYNKQYYKKVKEAKELDMTIKEYNDFKGIINKLVKDVNNKVVITPQQKKIYNDRFYQKNRDKILEKNHSEKYYCPLCETTIKKASKYEHEKGKSHSLIMKKT